jgi:hypothetical protein
MMKGKLGEPYQQACKSLYVPFCPSQARDLCLRVLRENGLTDWQVMWEINTEYLAACVFDNKTIILSLILLDESKSSVLDTIRHEVAHALAGPTDHDLTWAKIAIRLGCCENRGTYQAMIALLQEAANSIREELTHFEMAECLVCEQRHLVIASAKVCGE